MRTEWIPAEPFRRAETHFFKIFTGVELIILTAQLWKPIDYFEDLQVLTDGSQSPFDNSWWVFRTCLKIIEDSTPYLERVSGTGTNSEKPLDDLTSCKLFQTTRSILQMGFKESIAFDAKLAKKNSWAVGYISVGRGKIRLKGCLESSERPFPF